MWISFAEFVKGAAANKGKNETADEKKVEKPRFRKAKFLDDDAKQDETVQQALLKTSQRGYTKSQGT
ncbi:unnamed protein product [Cercospora beticola]|nr:unnamed protein product [Cercospora beticola]